MLDCHSDGKICYAVGSGLSILFPSPICDKLQVIKLLHNKIILHNEDYTRDSTMNMKGYICLGVLKIAILN